MRMPAREANIIVLDLCIIDTFEKPDFTAFKAVVLMTKMHRP
jgi:hypothetical protein